MKVKWIRLHHMFAHDVNEVCELTDEHGAMLVASGHVESLEEEKPETAVVAPESAMIKPGRKPGKK